MIGQSISRCYSCCVQACETSWCLSCALSVAFDIIFLNLGCSHGFSVVGVRCLTQHCRRKGFAIKAGVLLKQWFFFIVHCAFLVFPVSWFPALQQITGLVVENTFTSLRDIAYDKFPELRYIRWVLELAQVSENAVSTHQ